MLKSNGPNIIPCGTPGVGFTTDAALRFAGFFQDF